MKSPAKPFKKIGFKPHKKDREGEIAVFPEISTRRRAFSFAVLLGGEDIKIRQQKRRQQIYGSNGNKK